MKNRVLFSLTFLTVLLFAGSLLAQGSNIGIRGGLNIANLGGSDVENTDSKTGVNFGGFFHYAINEIFSIQPEVLYSAKGAKAKFVEDGVTVDAKLNLNYIDIPVLLVVNLPVENASIKPHLIVGPHMGILLSAKVKGEAGGFSGEVDVKDVYKSTDFGAVVGAGIGIPVGNNMLNFDFRYHQGLTSIDDSGEDLDEKNRGFSINAAFGFNLAR